jgi:hypothetical protein
MLWKKTREINQKVGKNSWTISQMFAHRPKHDKIQAWWALDILSKSILERVWWCKRSKMEFWSWIICCSMSCWHERKHAQTKGNRKSHVALRCYWKGNVLLSIHDKASRKKGCWTINLTPMTKAMKAQFIK